MTFLQQEILEIFAEAQGLANYYAGRSARHLHDVGLRVKTPRDRKYTERRRTMRQWEAVNHARRREYKTDKQKSYALQERVRQLRQGVTPKKWGKQWREAKAILESELHDQSG